MRLSDFHYELPEHLIAQRPLPERSASRLLCLDRLDGSVRDRMFRDLPGLLHPNDLLVFNDTRVIPARLLGRKRDTGGAVEVLVERVLGRHHVLAHIRASKSPRAGVRLCLEGLLEATVEGRDGDLFRLHFNGDGPVVDLLEQHGRMPLPPYIDRADTEDDRARYQTVYARCPGAVAAPTAGLHFDAEMMECIRAHGVATAAVTLHVGAGTFQPVRVQDLSKHVMHSEWFEVNEDICRAVDLCRSRGGRVVAVGTTAVRSLESAAATGTLRPRAGDTRLFIVPGYRFKVVDALITNFHLPESTLLMLVSAFAGHASVMEAYRHAVSERYRFFSYGDAMWIGSEASSSTDRAQRRTATTVVE